MRKLNLRPYNNKELLLFPPSVGDYLPKDDLAHVIDEAVDVIDLSSYYAKIPEVGNPSYHPALMIKIWFYGYATKVYSSRKLEEKLHKDVAFIFLAGMQKPDFKTISEFRRKNLTELKGSFVEILQICHRLGMTKLGEISLDSKVIKANASPDRFYDEERFDCERKELEEAISKYLEKVNQTDIEEDQKYGKDKRGNELPEEIRKKEERLKKMKEIMKELKKQGGKAKINLSDKDAQFQKGGEKIVCGYRAQIAVDSQEQVIVANEVTNQQHDSTQLIPMIGEILKNLGELEQPNSKKLNKKKKVKLIADGGYHSGKNLDKLSKGRYKDIIDPYIPDTNSDKREHGKGYDRESPFHRSKFIYNRKGNSFRCPAGKELPHIGNYLSHGVRYSVYGDLADCKDCRYFGQCTTSRHGRRINISEYQEIVDEMHKKLSRKEGKKIYGLRKITVEPVIGNLSENLGFRSFLLRGLEKVKGEFSLMCTAHNFLKMAKHLKQLGTSLKQTLNRSKLPLVLDTS